MREEEMNCRKIGELLTAYLDGEVTAEEKAYIDAHLPDCPRCSTELEAFSAIQGNLRGALTAMAGEADPSPQVWKKVRDRLETGESRKGFWSSFTPGRLTAAATAVVILVIAIAIWQFGGFFGGMSSPPPAPAPIEAPEPAPSPEPAIESPPPEIPIPAPTEPTPTPAPEPAPAPTTPTIPPMPAPRPPFEAMVTPEEAYYLPGEPIAVRLSLTNESSEPITLESYPPAIQVTPHSDYDQVLVSVPAGTQPREIEPDETVTMDFAWNQQDSQGEQVPPGWYDITFKDVNISYETTKSSGTNPTAKVLIQYPQGHMEKTIVMKESRTVDGITVTLERIELSPMGMTVYTLSKPPGYTSPQGILPTSAFMIASAEYSIDGGIIKQAGLAGFGFLEEGTRFTWKELDPAPADAKELTFRIFMRWEDKPEELLGPWEFTVVLE